MALSGLSGCEEIEAGASITSVVVDPDTVEFNHYNGEMTVLITVAGFSGEIVEADAFIETDDTGTERDAAKQGFTVRGNDIELHGIPKTWLSQLTVGTYPVGARVISSTGENISQSDLGSVKVVE